MSTLKTTNLQHPSAGVPAIVLDADGDATYAGVHDFSAATVTGAPQGLVHINTTTFTAQSSVSINSIFSASFENYKVLVNITDASPTNQALLMRLRASGSDNSTGNYVTNELYQTSTTVGGRVNFTGNDDWYLGIVDATFDDRYSANLEIIAPQAATNTKALLDSGNASSTGDYYQNRHALFFNAATQFDGFSLFLTSGNITGTIRVYGYSNGA